MAKIFKILNNKKYRKLIKLLIKIDIIAVLGLVISILTTDIFKKPIIKLKQDVPVTFLINNEYYGFYDLYTEQMQEDVYLTDKLMTTINIANPLSNDIQLNKIYININNIKQDYNPYFKIYLNVEEGGVYAYIINCGWGSAENIDFIFTSDDDILFDYIGKSVIDVHVDQIEVGERIVYPFILNNELRDIGINSAISFSVNCNMNNVDISESIMETFLFFDIFNGEFFPPGIGGTSDYIYGIKFDSEKSSFSYERTILEEVYSGEIMVFPICIYPDQTCTFDLDIGFQYLYNGKEKYVHCRQKNNKVYIDSSYLNEYTTDIRNLITEEDISKNIDKTYHDWQGEIIYSYPAINSCIAYPRCPSCNDALSCKMNLLTILGGNKFNKIWYCENCNKRL